MTSRLIEECLTKEELEEKEYNVYMTVDIGKAILVVDPYVININDLTASGPIEGRIVRVRRPFWGQGDLHRFIYKLEV